MRDSSQWRPKSVLHAPSATVASRASTNSVRGTVTPAKTAERILPVDSAERVTTLVYLLLRAPRAVVFAARSSFDAFPSASRRRSRGVMRGAPDRHLDRVPRKMARVLPDGRHGGGHARRPAVRLDLAPHRHAGSRVARASARAGAWNPDL